MILDCIHPGAPNVSKETLRGLLSKKYRTDEKNIVLFGFKTHFGGGRSTGFCLIYDNRDYMMKYEPKGRLRKLKLVDPKIVTTRKTRKEIKIKRLKVRGKAKSKVQAGKQKK